jgi:SAM-dependent methyltransferase
MNESNQRNEEDSFRTQFWVKRWEREKQSWDLGHIPPNLAAFLTRSSSAPASVLVPGCGSGYEVRAFHEAGHDVEAIDFSGPAVAHARELLGPLGERIIHGNFFKHDFGEKRYSLIYERGFLCSFAPAHWEDYVSRMAGLLSPGGRLVGLFLYGDEPEPPPYPLTDETASALFGRSFRLVNAEAAAADSVPVYEGKERWQEWKKTG